VIRDEPEKLASFVEVIAVEETVEHCARSLVRFFYGEISAPSRAEPQEHSVVNLLNGPSQHMLCIVCECVCVCVRVHVKDLSHALSQTRRLLRRMHSALARGRRLESCDAPRRRARDLSSL
jgi:hypothetical protein